MHVEADLLHGVLQLRASESQVLQATNNGAIVRRIRSPRSRGGGELGVRVDRSGRRRAIKHSSTLENILSILMLMEKEPVRSVHYLKAEEVVKRAEVLDVELSAKTINELSKKSIVVGCQDNVVNIE
jgi:hypothetical protein